MATHVDVWTPLPDAEPLEVNGTKSYWYIILPYARPCASDFTDAGHPFNSHKWSLRYTPAHPFSREENLKPRKMKWLAWRHISCLQDTLIWTWAWRLNAVLKYFLPDQRLCLFTECYVFTCFVPQLLFFFKKRGGATFCLVEANSYCLGFSFSPLHSHCLDP